MSSCIKCAHFKFRFSRNADATSGPSALTGREPIPKGPSQPEATLQGAHWFHPSWLPRQPLTTSCSVLVRVRAGKTTLHRLTENEGANEPRTPRGFFQVIPISAALQGEGSRNPGLSQGEFEACLLDKGRGDLRASAIVTSMLETRADGTSGS